MWKIAFASYLMECYSSRKKSNTWDWKVVIKVLVSFACDPTPSCPEYKIFRVHTSFSLWKIFWLLFFKIFIQCNLLVQNNTLLNPCILFPPQLDSN